jgi:hypothetical protein
VVLFILAAQLGCYPAPSTGEDTGAVAPLTLALDGPCGRYAWLTLEGVGLRLESDTPCTQCGVTTSLAPDEHGYRSQLIRDGAYTTTSWVCTQGQVSVRQVAYGDDGANVDAYEPPIVRWVKGTAVGESWTADSVLSQIRDGELKDRVQRSVTYTVEAEETLDLRPGLFSTVRVRDVETGALRWLSEGFGLVQVVDEDGTSSLTGLSWPGEDTGG